jgi:hypothetical protein
MSVLSSVLSVKSRMMPIRSRYFNTAMQHTGLHEGRKVFQLVTVKVALKHLSISTSNDDRFVILPIPRTERICDAKPLTLESKPPTSFTSSWKSTRTCQVINPCRQVQRDYSPARDAASSANTMADSSSVRSESLDKTFSISSSSNISFLVNLVT